MRVTNYRILGDLGGGRFEAEHAVLPRRAVIKTIPDALAWMKGLRVAVMREACILEALQHPGVARLYETGLFEDGRPWFACEDVEGTALSDLRRQLGLAELVALMRDVADVLAHAHRRGIIHGGLHPDRIILTERAFPIVIDDWSTARAHDAPAAVPSVPRPDARRFQAPELACGDAIDDRADVYALGAIAKAALPTNAPAALVRLIEQMMAADRWDRPAITEVRAALETIPTTAMQTRWTPAFGVPSKSDDSDEVTQEEVILVELS